MVPVTETYPGSLISYNAKSDIQAVPVGQEDKWWDAGDVNDTTNPLLSLARAIRLNAAIAAITGTTEAINGKAARYTGVLSGGLPVATATLSTELNKLFAAAVETIEQGGDLDGTASNTAFFGVPHGIVSGTTAQFTTNTLLGLSAGGGLVTYTSGALPPVGIGLVSNFAYVDLGGRVRADNTSVKFNNSGQLVAVGGGLTPTLSTLTVTGAVTHQTSYKLVNNQNGQTLLAVSNSSTATAAVSDFRLAQGANQFVITRYRNSGGDGSNLAAIANSGVMFTGTSAAGGLLLISQEASAPIRFAAGGSATADELMQIDPTNGVDVFERFDLRANSPAQITSNQNNYDVGPTAFARLSTDASRNITGLTNGTNGRFLIISNIGSFDLVLQHQNASSTAANRIITPDGADVTLNPDESVWLEYDSTTSRWRILAGSALAAGIALHASTHERAGSDQIDGDHLDIDFTPTNYQPDTTPAEAANVDDLTAHLQGIDTMLELSKSITIESPSSSEDLSMFFTNKSITITEIRAVLRGSATPSVTWTIRHGTDRNAAGAEVVTGGTVTTSTTTGSDVTSFNDATIVADSFVWLETTAQSGTVDELSVTIFYKKT